eukprot:15476168-Alexandrium_andersonii.AAC.1
MRPKFALRNQASLQPWAAGRVDDECCPQAADRKHRPPMPERQVRAALEKPFPWQVAQLWCEDR